MTTNTDKLAAQAEARHIATGADLEWQAKIFHEEMDKLGVPRDDGEDFYSLIGRANLALEAAGRVQQAEPVAVLRFQRDTPGHENDMPAVVSCNWLPDGDYRVYLAAPAERAPAPAVGEAHTDRAPLGFTDHEKSAWSIGVEHGMRIVAPTAQEASKPVQAEAATASSAERSMSAIGWPIAGLKRDMARLRERWDTMKVLGNTGAGQRESDRFWAPVALTTMARYFEEIDAALATQPPAIPAAPAVQASGEREALIDLISQALQGTYHCTRVWAAWNVGTMSQDDFEPVEESDTPAELADAILAALASPPASGEKQV